MQMALTSFTRVQEILDGVMDQWSVAHGRTPDLSIHSDNSFGWTTKEQLADSDGFGNVLIDPALVGNSNGNETNLVVALRLGVPGFPRMPLDGPFIPDDQIDYIAQWIDEGMPD
jgi:hypothetical protein